MNILFGIAHPKHVHIFNLLNKKLLAKGHTSVALVVENDMILNLLKYYNFNYLKIGRRESSRSKLEYFKRLIRVIKNTKKNKPDIIIGQADPCLAIASKIINIPFVALPDTESAFLSTKIAFPLIDCLILSNSYREKVRKQHIRIPSYLELAYLHPYYFKPNVGIKKILGISENVKYSIIRFVSWNAHHDIGHKGLLLENKMKVVEELSKYGKVFISSEGELPDELMKYKINIKAENMHHVLSQASLFYGESATMAAESAVLGTPAIYIDNEGRGYTDELGEKYDLLFNFTESLTDQKLSIEKSIELLKTKDIKKQWQTKREKMIQDKIDVTSFMVWFIENYPESHKIMKENPGYQNRFK